MADCCIRGYDQGDFGHEENERFMGECDADPKGRRYPEIVKNKDLGKGSLDGDA